MNSSLPGSLHETTTPASGELRVPPRPRVLYATTREVTYARNQTLIRAIRHYADVDVVAPQGSGQGFDRRVAYIWGLTRVVTRTLARAIRRDAGDTLVVGFLAQPLAIVLRPFWRGRFVADAMVSVYDTLCYDKQLLTPGSAIGRAAWWLDAYLVRKADALLFDTRQHCEFFRTFATSRFPPAYVIPVGARPLKPSRVAKAQSDRLQVVFAGSYIPLQGAQVIVEAAGLLKEDAVDFTMIGSGQELAATRQLARTYDLGRIRFIGWVDLESLDDLYYGADVILGIFGQTPKTQRVVPNKVFEAVSIGKPVITGDTPAIRELFVPGRDLVCCPIDDPPALAEAIRWAHTHREQLRQIGRAGQRAFEQHASERALAAALQPLFEERGS